MNPTRLLLVEDNAVSRGFLGLALQSMPATVVDIATDAAQAVAHAQSLEEPHALWLLDANLPDASGEQLLDTLRELRPDVPALCLTAEVDPERLQALRSAGFAEVLEKPLTIAALHAAVRRALASGGNAQSRMLIWDDAQALNALGGNRAAVRAMRGLFLAELPLQAGAIQRAITSGDLEKARSELHKLRASCGFVGSQRLLDAVEGLSRALQDSRSLEHFRNQVVDALAAAQSLS
jgi:DNA-binding response OmpR family regulator